MNAGPQLMDTPEDAVADLLVLLGEWEYDDSGADDAVAGEASGGVSPCDIV
jgi:hypothetical protein|tara:strand:+ start:864 stop:1016 length:153 start_codon:yes stop_codon:yes gene_type:complete